MEPSVLHISNSRYGSLETAGHTREIWNELARGACGYHVLARGHKRGFQSEQADNVHLHLVPGVRSALFPPLAYWGLALARRYRPDVIMCQDPVLGGVAAVHTGRLLGIPVLMEIHTDVHFRNFTSRRPQDAVLGRLARYVLRESTAVRAVSPSFFEPLATAGVSRESIVYLPNRVDIQRFEPSDERRRRGRAALGVADDVMLVTSVGRFVPQKGYTELVTAFRDVRSRVATAMLLLVGGGPLRDEYVRSAARAGVQDAVRLVGWRDQEGLVDLLAATDVYVQPSVPGRGEAMPRAILEAMAMRLPLVVTRVGGIPDVVEAGRNGLVVEPANPAALSDAIITLAADVDSRRRMAAANLADVAARYEWTANFRSFKRVLRTLAASGHLPEHPR